MSIAEELKAEGILEGEKKLLLRLLELATPAVRARFRARVSSADSIEQLEDLGDQVLRATLPAGEG